MKTSHFKYNEYRITETSSGDVYWQTHHGFGSYREGRCFIRGDILFFGPAENEGLGYLFGDFIDSIKALPPWTRTKLYCNHSNIFYCDTGDKVSENEMRLWAIADSKIFKNRGDSGNNPIQLHHNTHAPKHAAGSYGLENYEIIVSSDGLVSWAIPGGNNNLTVGACLIIEDILFMTSSKSRQQLGNARERHYARISDLPKWDITRYYSHGAPLINCAVNSTIRSSAFRSPIRITSKIGPWARLANIVISWQTIITSETSARILSLITVIARVGLEFFKIAGSGLIKLLSFCLDKIKSIKITRGKN